MSNMNTILTGNSLNVSTLDSDLMETSRKLNSDDISGSRNRGTIHSTFLPHKELM